MLHIISSGVGIQMTRPLYQSPSLSGLIPGLVFAQNLPSVVCSHVLDPQPEERVLDMCAAPGILYWYSMLYIYMIFSKTCNNNYFRSVYVLVMYISEIL